MKKTLLALVHGEWASHTFRPLEISKALRETGEYDILFSGTGEYMESMVKPAGFEYIETPTLSKEHIHNQLTTTNSPRMFSDSDAKKYYQIESELLKRINPDIVLRDHFRELAGIATKQQGIYDVFLQLANCSHYYKFDFRPSISPIADILPDWLTRPILKPLSPFITGKIRRKVYGPIKKQMKQAGLPINPEVPEGYEPDLTLFLDLENLFPFPNRKSSYKYTGPILAKDSTSLPFWAEDFKNESRKKILVTNGTTNMFDVSKLCMEAFNDNPFAVAIESPRTLSSLFYMSPKINLNALLPSSDIFITHGGIGSTYMGLKSGIPMVVLPNHFEQEVNGNQIQKAGAGISLMKRHLSPESLRKSIEKILQNKSFKHNAEKLSRLFPQNPLELAIQYISEGYEKFRTQN